MLNFARNALVSTFRYSSDLILPPLCIGCSQLVTRHNLLCPRCWRELYFITPPLCHRFGTPLPSFEGNGLQLSSRAVSAPPVFGRARAAAHYAGIMRRLIVRFKFEDRHEPLPLFVKLMHDAGRQLLAESDLLMPVPLHRLRLLQRRFNQSAILAQRLSRVTGVPVDVTSLKRIRRTKPQVGLLAEERAANVDAAFALNRRRTTRVAGKRILLIDDVITTGATANACAAELLRCGAASVDILVIATTVPGATYEFDNVR